MANMGYPCMPFGRNLLSIIVVLKRGLDRWCEKALGARLYLSIVYPSVSALMSSQHTSL